MNLPPIIRLAKKYRWHAIGATVALIWVMGYVSLTYILPDNKPDIETTAPVEAEELQSQTKLEESDDDTHEPQDNSSAASNRAVASESDSQALNACSARTKNKLAIWLEEALASEQEQYTKQVAAIKLRKALDTFSSAAKSVLSDVKQQYEEKIAEVYSKHDQKLEKAGCDI